MDECKPLFSGTRFSMRREDIDNNFMHLTNVVGRCSLTL